MSTSIIKFSSEYINILNERYADAVSKYLKALGGASIDNEYSLSGGVVRAFQLAKLSKGLTDEEEAALLVRNFLLNKNLIIEDINRLPYYRMHYAMKMYKTVNTVLNDDNNIKTTVATLFLNNDVKDYLEKQYIKYHIYNLGKKKPETKLEQHQVLLVDNIIRNSSMNKVMIKNG